MAAAEFFTEGNEDTVLKLKIKKQKEKWQKRKDGRQVGKVLKHWSVQADCFAATEENYCLYPCGLAGQAIMNRMVPMVAHATKTAKAAFQP
jgi:hypothetical protein